MFVHLQKNLLNNNCTLNFNPCCCVCICSTNHARYLKYPFSAWDVAAVLVNVTTYNNKTKEITFKLKNYSTINFF